MKRNTLLAAMTLAATALGGAAFADANHGRGGQFGAQSGPGMMQNGGPGMMGNMGGMMDMMKRMHGNMMRRQSHHRYHASSQNQNTGFCKQTDPKQDQKLRQAQRQVRQNKMTESV